MIDKYRVDHSTVEGVDMTEDQALKCAYAIMADKLSTLMALGSRDIDQRIEILKFIDTPRDPAHWYYDRTIRGRVSITDGDDE